jgi:Tfp pilus assembly protein PilW
VAFFKGGSREISASSAINVGRVALTLLAVTLGPAGCGTVATGPRTSSIAETLCSEQATAFGPAFRVAAAFDTTVGLIRALYPRGQNPNLWSGLAAEQDAVLCYLDGPVAKSPPGGTPFDREVIGVASGEAEFIIAGYRTSLPTKAP